MTTAKKGPDWFREMNEKFATDRRKRHGDVLRAIRKPPTAIVMTDKSGRETLAIVTREMSNPEEGAWRASVYWRDGPVGHLTRKTLGKIAGELSSDYAPVKVRTTNDDEVMRWTGTREFTDGFQRVLETQAWNERERKR